jgi:predicted amidohydrolase
MQSSTKSNLFRIALIQLNASTSIKKNLQEGIIACEKAKAMDADLVLFPELWQLGYHSKQMHATNAIDIKDPFLGEFQKQAKQLQIAIAITFLAKGRKKPTNHMVLIDKAGTVILDYAKVHTCSFDEPESLLAPGKEFKVAHLEYSGGIVKLGAMICFDREFPESARTLMLKGAEIILTPNACLVHEDPSLGDIRLQQLRARAFENMVGIAMANYPLPRYDGHSCAIDVDGKPLITAGEEEGIYLASFDLEKIRQWRKKEVWGDQYRHPKTYLNLSRQ